MKAMFSRIVDKIEQADATVYFDGACSPNPGKMGLGVFVSTDHGLTIDAFFSPKKPGTNNIAEWMALRYAVKLCIRNDLRRVVFVGDSLIVVNQVNGKWEICDSLFPYYQRCLRDIEKLEQAMVIWIPRKLNTIADGLARKALCVKS